jgi:hypothetical protein
VSVKDLQDEIAKLKNRPVRSLGGSAPTTSNTYPDINQHANVNLSYKLLQNKCK